MNKNKTPINANVTKEIPSTYKMEFLSMENSEKHNQTTIKTVAMEKNTELDHAKLDHAYAKALQTYLSEPSQQNPTSNL
jgi:hypothetical protein